MWGELLHALQLVESVPVVLTLTGAAFVALDVLALYQLLKLYGAPPYGGGGRAGGAGRSSSAAAALLACGGGREVMYADGQLQEQQELQRRQPLLKKVWGRLLRTLFRGSAAPEAAGAAAGTYGGRRGGGAALAAAAPPATTTTGGQTRFAFMVLLFIAILARAASLFCMAWIVASRPAAVPALPSAAAGSDTPAMLPAAAPAGAATGAAGAGAGGSSSSSGSHTAAAAGLSGSGGGVAVAGGPVPPPSRSPAAAVGAGQPAAVASSSPATSGTAGAAAAGAHRSASGGRGTAAAASGGGRRGGGGAAAANAGPPAAAAAPSSGVAATSPPYFNFSLDAEWCLLFLDSAPALIFFASLSLIVLFWAKIYYAALLVSYPKLERGHWLFSGGLIALYLLFSLFAVILQAKRSATRALQLFIAFLFALAGGAFFVYGLKVARKLSERTKLSSRKSSIVKRVLFLSLACPVLFGARTLLALRGATPPLHPLLQGPSLLSQPLVTASAIFLLTEWVPAGLILAAFWHRKNRNSNVRSSQQQQLMQRQHQREQQERSFDSANVAAPLMQQPYYPYLAPPGYADPRTGAPAADANGEETLPGEQLGQPPVQQQQQPGVAYQPCYPLVRGPPGYALGNSPYPLQGYYTGQYPPQYYPPAAL